MKKRYVNPEMEVVEVKACQPLLTASLGFGEPTGTVDVREFEGFDELGNFEDLMKQMGL